MSLFLPTAAVGKVTNITPEMIREMGASAIILDVDNTLAAHGSPIPLMGTVEWAHAMRQAGLAVVIVSNNFKDRIASFAGEYDPPFLCMTMKPLPFAHWHAARFLGVSRNQATAVGDQVFTDVMDANVAGVKSVLLRPSDPGTNVSFQVRRRLEELIRRKVERRQTERKKTDRSGKA